MPVFDPDNWASSSWKTERLTLRPYDVSDVDLVHRTFDQDPEIWRHDPGYARTRDQRAKVLQRFQMLYRQFGFGPCAAFLTGSQEGDRTFVGQGGLNPYIYDHRDGSRTVEFEVMYKLARPFWSKGFATEIATFWVEFAFRDIRLPRLITCPAKSNSRSITVLRRLGALFEDDWLDPETTIAVIANPRSDPEQSL